MTDQASDKRAALLFSGGLDSTLAAVVLSEENDQVHLVSVARGYGHRKIDRTARRFHELESRIDSSEFKHAILDGRELFKQIVVRTLLRDIFRYKGLFVICVGCKLVMHALGAIYCLERGISHISDGASGATEWMSDQASVTLQGYRSLHASLGLEYSNPVVQIKDREHERERLRELGIETGRNVAGRDLGTQPVCLYGDFLTFLREAVFKVSLPVSDKAIEDYVDEKTELLLAYVHRHFEQVGSSASNKP